jgi:hypothetical protein
MFMNDSLKSKKFKNNFKGGVKPMEEKRELRYESPKIEVLNAVDIFEKIGPAISCSFAGNDYGTNGY